MLILAKASPWKPLLASVRAVSREKRRAGIWYRNSNFYLPRKKRSGNRENIPGTASSNPKLHVSHCILSRLYLLDEVFYFALQPPPLELDGHQLIGTHLRAVGVVCQLLLDEGHWEKEKSGLRYLCLDENWQLCNDITDMHEEYDNLICVFNLGIWIFEIFLGKAEFPRCDHPSTNQVTSWLHSLIGALLCLRLHYSDFILNTEFYSHGTHSEPSTRKCSRKAISVLPPRRRCGTGRGDEVSCLLVFAHRHVGGWVLLSEVFSAEWVCKGMQQQNRSASSLPGQIPNIRTLISTNDYTW